MREIKFRAWHEHGKRMVYGPSGDESNPSWVLAMCSASNIEPMQYTGLKDKNGKEIYEGDILNHRTYVRSNEFRRGVVCFDEKQCTYKFVPREAYESNAGNGGWSGFAFDYHICLETEIVGNIYEKPELLAVMDT